MSFAEDIGRYIQQEYENPYALPVSLNFTPDNTTDSISVYDTGGFASERSYTCPPMPRPSAQVNGTQYILIECNSPPNYIGATQVSTQGQAHEFVLNLSSLSGA